MTFVVKLAEGAASGGLPDGSPFSSAVPGKPKAPTAPKPAISKPKATTAGPVSAATTAATPAAPTLPPPPPAVSNANQLFGQMSPQIMQAAAPGVGSVGGMPALMALWDLIGGSGGQHLKTIFGDRFGQATGQIPGVGSAPQPRSQAPQPQATSAPSPAQPAPVPSAEQPVTAQPAAADPNSNWMTRFRDWQTRNTNIGVQAPIPGLDPSMRPDVGNMAADYGAWYGGSKGIGLASKAVTGKAPGMLPVTFALDGADIAGVNPIGDRFGMGVMGQEEASARGEALAKMPAGLRAASGFTAPLSTIYQGGALTDTADREMTEAGAVLRHTLANENARAQSLGRAPSLRPTFTSDYFQAREPDGSIRGKSLGEALSHIHNRAWESSSVPGLNYIYALAEADAEGSLAADEQIRRLNAWRDWAAKRETELTTAQAAGDPKAPAALAKLRQARADRAPTAREEFLNASLQALKSKLPFGS